MDNIYELWAAVLQELTGLVSTAVMSTWIKTLVPRSFDDDCLVLETSSTFKKDIIDKRFTSEIQNAACNVLGFDINIKIIVDEQCTEVQETTSNDISTILQIFIFSLSNLIFFVFLS